jgi:hypothetical protein
MSCKRPPAGVCQRVSVAVSPSYIATFPCDWFFRLARLVPAFRLCLLLDVCVSFCSCLCYFLSFRDSLSLSGSLFLFGSPAFSSLQALSLLPLRISLADLSCKVTTAGTASERVRLHMRL